MAVSLPWTKQPAPRRNSVVQTKLSGLWQASASSLGQNELAFGAVSVNLPHLSAQIKPSVKSSKSSFARGFAHGSTHNGIRLESTAKRKDTLLGTLEDGVQYAETFKACCRRKYGNMTRAWRILLNPGGNGRVSFVPFCNAARSMGFVNVSTLPGKASCLRVFFFFVKYWLWPLFCDGVWPLLDLSVQRVDLITASHAGSGFFFRGALKIS